VRKSKCDVHKCNSWLDKYSLRLRANLYIFVHICTELYGVVRSCTELYGVVRICTPMQKGKHMSEKNYVKHCPNWNWSGEPVEAEGARRVLMNKNQH
jgi:hypothetical protein